MFFFLFYSRDDTGNISHSSVNCNAVAATPEILRDFAFLVNE